MPTDDITQTVIIDRISQWESHQAKIATELDLAALCAHLQIGYTLLTQLQNLGVTRLERLIPGVPEQIPPVDPLPPDA